MKFKPFVVSLTLLLFCNSVGVSAKVIDLRNKTDASGHYDISFCARPSPTTKFPGHAFVAFSSVNAKGDRLFLAIGHTASDTVQGALSYFDEEVPGYLSEELYTSIKQRCLTAKVNRDIYNLAMDKTRSPLAELGFSDVQDQPVLETYKLGEKDCLDFTLSIARELEPLGLVIPKRREFELPLMFLERLTREN